MRNEKKRVASVNERALQLRKGFWGGNNKPVRANNTNDELVALRWRSGDPASKSKEDRQFTQESSVHKMDA